MDPHHSLSFNPSSFPAETTEFYPLSANSGGGEEDVVQVNFTTSSCNNNFQTTQHQPCERRDKAVAVAVEDQRGRD